MADEWQDIETAPRDGRVIIGWVNGWPPCTISYCETGRGWEEDQPGWYDPHSQVWLDPTHWRPLPAPPVRQPQEVDT